MWARLPGLDPDSTRGPVVSTVARNLFDWLNFRHDTRQDTRDCRPALYRACQVPTSSVYTREQGTKVRPSSDLRSRQCIQQREPEIETNGRRDHIYAVHAATKRTSDLGAIATPSLADASTVDARRMRSSIRDGTSAPGTSFARYSASSTLSNGRTLNTTGRPDASSRR